MIRLSIHNLTNTVLQGIGPEISQSVKDIYEATKVNLIISLFFRNLFFEGSHCMGRGRRHAYF